MRPLLIILIIISLRTVPQPPPPASDGADWRGHLLPGYQHQIQRAGGQGVVQVIQYSTVQYSTVQYSVQAICVLVAGTIFVTM